MEMSLKRRLEKAQERKGEYLNKAHKAHNEYLAEVYYGLANGKPVREIHKEIRKVAQRDAKRGLFVDRKAMAYAEALAKKGAKRLYGASFSKALNGGGVLAVAGMCFAFLQREEAYEGMRKIAYEGARRVERDAKGEILIDASKSAESEAKGLPPKSWRKIKVFYIASEHNDCAEDHLPYQGKLYYDRFWRRFVKDEEARREVQNIITARGMRSMQWVINRPVWFITRPNCRHYFEQVTIGEAMRSTDAEIVGDHNMHRSVGQRGVNDQTIRHSTKEEWYTESNVRNIIKQYRERLEYHKALYAKTKDPKMLAYCQKDERLIKKWEYYLAHNL